MTARNAVAVAVAAALLALDWITSLDLLALAVVAPLLVLLIRPAPTAAPHQAVDVPLPRAEAVVAYLERRIQASPGFAPSLIALKPRMVGRVPGLSPDAALACASRAIRPILRAEDLVGAEAGGVLVIALSARQSGSLENLIQVALRLQRTLQMPGPDRENGAVFSTAVGICCEGSRASAMGAQDCLAATLRAVARAENRGRNEIEVVQGHTLPGSPPPLDLALDLDRALADGQIVPFFQPQVCTDSGALSGVEALARWIHPDLGVLSPAQFLPTVKAAGADRTLTDTITRQALRALAEWDRQGLGIPRVSINMTRDDLDDPKLADRLDWLLDGSGLTPNRLGIEILETVLSLDANGTIPTTLAKLSARGFMIDLDDFGTGQASIASIRRFCVDRLKIDRSFVRGLDQDPDQQGMVAAMVTMAEQLKLQILAEGIETAGEHARAAQLGCGHVQGFGIGKPMRAEALPGWLRRWRQDHGGRALPDAFRHLPDPPALAPKGKADWPKPTGKTA
ncbi:EAL domain-containing protein [Maribius pontilimi]|uniref:EAL domain-containing protein n=1 Tax=Palleronia pontilimi TaxID=1964209 RepID=A0A934IK59_9RHOB|nr:EAL domain-containing protein [Palleronia pontilimi]MBJ3764456.1 EAL domain-containing protein [Palleronia pontilimi]